MFKKNHIGNTDLLVTELGFGAASLGNLYKPVTDTQAHASIETAWQENIAFFDTAPHYGLGLSERRIGDVLRHFSSSDYVLSTKVGRVLTPDIKADTTQLRYGFDTPMPFDAHYDYSYDGIMRSYFDSLQRLGLAKIDILLVHDLGADTHGERDSYYYNQLVQSGYKALEELRSQGLVKAIGLGVNETEICERAMNLGQWDCFLLAGRYSLLEQDALTGFLPKCEDHGASIILGGPYNSGILATGVKRGGVVHYNYAPAPQSIIQKVSQIEGVCEIYDVPLAAAALQFPTAHQSVASVIPGLGSAKRVTETVKLFNCHIPAEFWTHLKISGLLHEDAPVPEAI